MVLLVSLIVVISFVSMCFATFRDRGDNDPPPDETIETMRSQGALLSLRQMILIYLSHEDFSSGLTQARMVEELHRVGENGPRSLNDLVYSELQCMMVDGLVERSYHNPDKYILSRTAS